MYLTPRNPRLLIVGHGRHGKDTVCEILRDKYGFTFESSSKFCSKKFIFNKIKDFHGYATEEECYNDRHNHRELWYTLISTYCKKDPARLGREIFQEFDIYCGLRNKREFHSMRNQGVFDYVIWVDRSEHLPPEPIESMSLETWMADFVIDNNGTLEDLEDRVAELIPTIRPYTGPTMD